MPEILTYSLPGDSRAELAEAVIAAAGHSATGLKVILDETDQSNFINPKYRHKAFHANIEAGGIEEISPQNVLEAMGDRSCSHLIWLSKGVVEGPELPFIWILAHELGHHQQDLAVTVST